MTNSCRYSNISLKRTDASFNKLPPVLVVGQTINKKQKGSGGIIGISTPDGSVQRWDSSSHIRTALLSNLKHSLD